MYSQDVGWKSGLWSWGSDGAASRGPSAFQADDTPVLSRLADSDWNWSSLFPFTKVPRSPEERVPVARRSERWRSTSSFSVNKTLPPHLTELPWEEAPGESTSGLIFVPLTRR